MEPLKPPKDVLGLGQHLVHELGLVGRRDTLGSWMAHHLAELIDKAENGQTEAGRSQAQKTATETILKVWEHRRSLPGKAYPLASYENVLKVLDVLRPSNNPFWRFSHHGETKRDQLAADLFDGLSRLIVALLLMGSPLEEKPTTVNTAAIDALSETEQYMLTTLQQWGELFVAQSDHTEETGRSDEGDTKVDLNEAAVQLIDRITAVLDELRTELQKSAGSQILPPRPE